jgi:hypothetical protein
MLTLQLLSLTSIENLYSSRSTRTAVTVFMGTADRDRFKCRHFVRCQVCVTRAEYLRGHCV